MNNLYLFSTVFYVLGLKCIFWILLLKWLSEIPAVTWCDKTPIYFMNVGFNAQGDKFIRPC